MFELNDSIKKPSTGNTGGQIDKSVYNKDMITIIHDILN